MFCEAVENICALAIIVLWLLPYAIVSSKSGRSRKDETGVCETSLIEPYRVLTFKMPKVKCSDIVRLRGFVNAFGEKYFTTDGIILFRRLC
jgi:hypothetical protein